MAKGHDYGLGKGSKPQGGYNNMSKGNRPQGGGYNGMGRNFGGNRSGSYNPNNQGQRFDNTNAVPTAPYNFVSFAGAVLRSPLNDYVKGIKGTMKIQEAYNKYLCENETFTGHFEVELENLTPFYIEGKEGFFSDGENLCVPGSSLRGCIKNTFKIITASAFRDDKDNADVYSRYLFFRSFASPYKAFNEAYTNKISQKGADGKMRSVAKAGFLVRKDKEYFICPAQYTAVRTTSNRANPFKAPCLEWNNDNVEVYTGKMNFNKDEKKNKKHFYRITKPEWKTKILVTKSMIADYLDDKNRKGLNLLDKKNSKGRGEFINYALLRGAMEYDYVVPCFYSASGNVATSFGSGPYYRIPYSKNIGEHIPAMLKTEDVDFTDAVFGNKECWCSRVYFEDLYLERGKSGNKLPENYLKPLMGPNPNSFQNYLLPTNKQANHWDTDASLRGYKMYWHRMPEWQEENNKKENLNKLIAPVKEGTKFVGRIRFENLTAIEIGALSTVLGLCDDGKCCFKLGMGKPVGLGCVRVNSRLYLKKEGYYGSLFSENGFADAELVSSEEYVSVFDEFINGNFSGSQRVAYNSSIKDLKLIMDTTMMKDASWSSKTRYLDINDRNDKKIANYRIPLPNIENVVKMKK